MSGTFAEGIEAEAAKKRLARRLYETMEFLDPSDAEPWELIDPSSRDFYENVVSNLLADKGDVLWAIDAPDCDFVNGRPRSGQ